MNASIKGVMLPPLPEGGCAVGPHPKEPMDTAFDETGALRAAAQKSDDTVIPVWVPTPDTDLAKGRPATCSGAASPALACDKGADGDLYTRWGGNAPSVPGRPQTWQVDLGAAQAVGSVRISWGLAYAKSYSLEVSTDGTQWSSFFNTSSGTGATETMTGLSAHGRFVRISLTEPRPQSGWGFRYNFD